MSYVDKPHFRFMGRDSTGEAWWRCDDTGLTIHEDWPYDLEYSGFKYYIEGEDPGPYPFEDIGATYHHHFVSINEYYGV